MDKIYLTGFMGTGKTSSGEELAKRLNWQFVDLDDLIEEKEKRRISEIFAKEGETYFRQVEKEVLKQVSSRKNLVIACGGGIVIDKENVELMKKSGVAICLTASSGAILERVSKTNHRPLLNVDNPRQKIEELLKSRNQFYSRIEKVIDTTGLSVSQTADEIMKAFTQ